MLTITLTVRADNVEEMKKNLKNKIQYTNCFTPLLRSDETELLLEIENANANLFSHNLRNHITFSLMTKMMENPELRDILYPGGSSECVEGLLNGSIYFDAVKREKSDVEYIKSVFKSVIIRACIGSPDCVDCLTCTVAISLDEENCPKNQNETALFLCGLHSISSQAEDFCWKSLYQEKSYE